MIDSGEKPLDDIIIVASKEVIKNAGLSKVLVEEMPKKTEDIINQTTKLRQPIEYTNILQQLNDTYNAFETSVKNYKRFLCQPKNL